MMNRPKHQRQFKNDEELQAYLAEFEKMVMDALLPLEPLIEDDETPPVKDTLGERYRQYLIDECGYSPLHALSGEEYDQQFERDRLEAVRQGEIINEQRVAEGLHPIYHLTGDELVLIGVPLPRELLQNKDYQYVERTVKEECERIKKLKAAGKKWKPWSELGKAS